jgi:hypothetical protein
LKDSLARLVPARDAQSARVQSLCDEKQTLDGRLTQELSQYDSAFMADAREAERSIGALDERLRHLHQLRTLHEHIRALYERVTELAAGIDTLTRQIQDEKDAIAQQDDLVDELQKTYLDCLLAARVPMVDAADKIEIDTKSWIPTIYTRGDKSKPWGYANVGSQGMQTLLKVCWALAVHIMATRHELPLPPLLVIDTPSKNIDDRVNETVYNHLYECIFHLAAGELSTTQFLIIDGDYPAVSTEGLNIVERLLTKSDPDHPPLIGYYPIAE